VLVGVKLLCRPTWCTTRESEEEEEARREHSLMLLEEAERVHPYALTVRGDR
jgi:hypothetical protein